MNAQQQSISIILGEHRALTVVIDVLTHLANEIADRKLTPDYKLMWSILYYIEEFPERLHHPKEESILFPLIRLRTNSLDETLDELGRQHVNSKAPLDVLKSLLGRMEADISNSPSEFAEKTRAYAGFHWKHMGLEESVILPRAKELFSEADWEAVAEAFGGNKDPLLSIEARDTEWFRLFYRRLVTLVPEPWGLGERR